MSECPTSTHGDSWWCPAVGFSWVSQPWGCTSAWSLSVIVIRARPRVPTCHGNFPEKSLLVLLRVGTLVEWRFSKDPDFLWLFLILILLMATRNPARSHQLRERYFIPVFTMYLQGAFYIPVPGGDRRISSFQPNQSTLLISAGRSPWNQWGGEVFFFFQQENQRPRVAKYVAASKFSKHLFGCICDLLQGFLVTSICHAGRSWKVIFNQNCVLWHTWQPLPFVFFPQPNRP